MTLRRTNWHIWSGAYRAPLLDTGRRALSLYPTLVVDLTLDSWALPFAIHAGGPLLGKPGYHFRILCVNIGWSRL